MTLTLMVNRSSDNSSGAGTAGITAAVSCLETITLISPHQI